MNHILHLTTKLLEDSDDVLVDDLSLLAIVISDTFYKLASGGVGGPLGGDVCNGGVGWDDGNSGEEAFVGRGAGLGVEVLERHFDGTCALEDVWVLSEIG
jgi:hypothetical protein